MSEDALLHMLGASIREKTVLLEDIDRTKLYHVVYEYVGEQGWAVAHVVKTDGSKEDIPEICRRQVEIHFTYTVEADNKQDAIKKAEEKRNLPNDDPDAFRGLVV